VKVAFRIFLILVAAFVVVGVTYAIGRTEWATERAQSAFSRPSPGGSQSLEGFERPEGESRPAQGYETPAGLERRGHGRPASPLSTASLLSFARTLIPMALVIAVVALATKAIDAIRRRTEPARE
jgi:hypothetical protein